MKTTGMALSLGLLLTASLLTADTLRLRSGAQVTGTYLGGDTRQVKFLGADGNMKTYGVSEIATIDFSVGETSSASAPAPPPPPPTLNPAPAPAYAAASPTRSLAAAPAVTIPTNTPITVRMIDSIDADVTGAGERFRASIDDPIMVNGQTVVPRGADATVQIMRVEQAGKISGSDEVALKLYDITINGRSYETVTEYAEVKGEGQGKKTAKTTAVTTGVGAIIGAVIGGGKGAAIGAGAGAATGVAVSAARGKTLRIPSETRLDFVLRAPLSVN
jgi:hypothetical protein